MQQVLEKYFADLKETKTPFEIIAVNDGCTDGSQEILTEFAKNYRNFRVINLEGRSGKQAAIIAGMDLADPKSDTVILADIDPLNPIGILGKIADHIGQGEKVVYARREVSGFRRFHDSVSDIYTRLGAKLFGIEGIYTGHNNITAYSREVVDVMRALPAHNKFLRTMDTWIGWKIYYMSYVSGFNKVEEKNVIVNAKSRRASIPVVKGKSVKRDNVREHTASLDYMWGFLSAAVVMMIFGIVFATVLGGEAWVHLLIWLAFTSLLLLAFAMYTRAVLIKRVGIIYDHQKQIFYKVQNVQN